jgi:hypothetical protein
LIEKQASQLAQLRSQLQSLRTQYNDFKRDYQLQSLQLQRRLHSLQWRRDLLTRRLQELHESESDRGQEQMAVDMIEQIWSILVAHRRPSLPSDPPYAAPRFDDDAVAPEPDYSPPRLDDDDVTANTPVPYVNDRGLGDEDTPTFFESIAARRTRRPCAMNVYDKQPSLRAALTPSNPYTFSVEGGRVTPAIPEGYTRNTPMTSRRGTSRSSRRK